VYLVTHFSGGSDKYEGRLEVKVLETWGTVCDHRFGDEDARVVCRQLGLSEGSAICCAAFGEGSLPIIATAMNCRGSEKKLQSCQAEWGTFQLRCNHSQDVGVQCGPPNDNKPDTARDAFTDMIPFMGAIVIVGFAGCLCCMLCACACRKKAKERRRQRSAEESSGIIVQVVHADNTSTVLTTDGKKILRQHLPPPRNVPRHPQHAIDLGLQVYLESVPAFERKDAFTSHNPHIAPSAPPLDDD